MSSNIINIYIPRILGSVKRNTIINTFSYMNIGDIFYIDMYKKMNENKNPYYFAFISLKLYDSKSAQELEETLNEKGVTRITYDKSKNHYWEVKKHIDRSLRGRVPSPTSVTAVEFFDNEYGNEKINKKTDILRTSFTKQDRDDLEKEYEELEREINLVVKFYEDCNNILYH